MVDEERDSTGVSNCVNCVMASEFGYFCSLPLILIYICHGEKKNIIQFIITKNDLEKN